MAEREKPPRVRNPYSGPIGNPITHHKKNIPEKNRRAKHRRYIPGSQSTSPDVSRPPYSSTAVEPIPHHHQHQDQSRIQVTELPAIDADNLSFFFIANILNH